MDRGLVSWAAAKVDVFGVVSTLANEIPDNKASPHMDKSVLSLLVCSDSRGGSAVRRFDRLGGFIWGVDFAGEELLELEGVEWSPDDVNPCVWRDPEREESEDFEGLCDCDIEDVFRAREG